MSGLFLVEQKAIVTITEEQNLMATFMDAVSSIPIYYKVRRVLSQNATVITKCGSTHLR